MQEILKKYTDYLRLERHYSPLTVQAYEVDVASFWQYCITIDTAVAFSDIDYSWIRNWIMQLSEEKKSTKTINRKISSLKSFFKFLKMIGVVENYPLTGHKSLRTEKKIQVPFSEAEMEAVYQYDFGSDYSGVRNRLVIELFYRLGIRRAELLSLKCSDVDLKGKTVKVLGKRNKERILPLTKELVEMIQVYFEMRAKITTDSNDVLILLENGNILNQTFVYRLINNYFRGITSKEKKSPHMLRHTFATHLLNNGADLNSIKELMGHSSLSSTQVYTNSSISELKKIYGKAHPRSEKDD